MVNRSQPASNVGAYGEAVKIKIFANQPTLTDRHWKDAYEWKKSAIIAMYRVS